MKKIIIATATLALLAAPALAQRRGQGAQQPSAEDIAKKQQSEALDRQYKDTLKRMRDSADATKK
jgi:hypothetical protein